MIYRVYEPSLLDTQLMEKLCLLLADCIGQGASLGFHRPANMAQLYDYWHSVAMAVRTKQKALFTVETAHGALVGTAQLSYCSKQNGQHRAEIEKLLIDPQYQRQGIARNLLRHIETVAHSKGLQLLFLDTATGDKSEDFYKALNYALCGAIPNYVSCEQGKFHSTSIYYKLLA